MKNGILESFRSKLTYGNSGKYQLIFQ